MPSSEVMSKYKRGQLHSGSAAGPTVKNRQQAIAIMLSERRAEKAHGGVYPEKQRRWLGGLTGMPGVTSLPGGLGGLGGTSPGMPMMPSPGSAVPPLPGQWPQPGQAPLPGHVPMEVSMPAPSQPSLMGMTGGQGPSALGSGYAFGGSPLPRPGRSSPLHVGPIASAVGGRTDHHDLSVPSGSYVLPAAHVSGIGQGNTLNGFKILQNMFGPPMPIKHGAGLPRAPRLRASGGRDEAHIGRPVPILAAGGEFVLSPDQVMRGPVNSPWNVSLEDGHKILDDWVKRTHKKVGKQVANLPPPAKT